MLHHKMTIHVIMHHSTVTPGRVDKSLAAAACRLHSDGSGQPGLPVAGHRSELQSFLSGVQSGQAVKLPERKIGFR
ncbi:hypothetical protein HDIA_1100 [Hartmannibacter diazotrophicus]|uniref:Uncharacterized protein n=1 Tax=Hartmannibacter diazotrophicus TaxID=1482074 RepID=A0A2C9D4E2_9HYPH|nr:hypothetical protein HDIA_1100 [Hartmannibacter diazotrophicus]